MFKIYRVFILCCFTSIGFSQNEANIWYFGHKAGLDFNSGSPVPLLDGQLDTTEGCASISDATGSLLFYTDGITVWNRNHGVMANGTGLNGDISSTQSAIIVPKPNDPNIYYIFTVDNLAEANGLQYSEVDMTLDGGFGGITSNKNIMLHTPTTEKIAAIKSAVDNEYWVVSHKWESDEFMAFRVSDTGVNPVPVTSASGPYIGGYIGRVIGQLKIAPDGSKLAMATSDNMNEAHLFDFDPLTGVVSNPLTLLDLDIGEDVYGVEFSPNSKVLYVSARANAIFQYNLQAGSPTSIVNSKLKITTIPRGYSSLQLAPDGKIYVAKGNTFYIDVISNPNIVGLGCNYMFDGVYLGGPRGSLGLPPFIQSFFNIGFDVEHLCYGEVTQFLANFPEAYDTILWDFGDGNTSVLENPTHTYNSVGDYEVTLTVTAGIETSEEKETITIYGQPTATQPPNILLCDDNNDGFGSFDLSAQDTTILNGQDSSLFNINYYASLIDYSNNIPITDPSNYINVIAFAPQTIVASVKNVNNNECETFTTFDIQVFELPMPSENVPNLSFCDNTIFGTDDDGIIEFDLTQNEAIILNGQSASDFMMNYFIDATFSSEILTPNNYVNSSVSETIYVQVSNKANPTCTENTQFGIEVYELPTVTPIVELKQCDDDLDGFSIFNLTEVNAELSVNYQNEIISFYETQTDAENGNNAITNEIAYANQVVSTDAVWARIENNNGCFRTAKVNLIVSTTQIPNTYARDFYECDDGNDTTDGIATFDLSSVDTEIQAMFPVGQQLIIKYYRNQAEALSETNPITNIASYQNIGYPNMQDIFIRVDSALDNDCLGLGHHITLHIETVPVAYPVAIPQECDDDGDGMYAFDTSYIESELLNGQSNVTVTYNDENGNPLPSPLPNPFMTATQTIMAKVTNATSQDPNGACYDETTISFVVDAAVIAYPVEDLVVCDDDNDGKYDFDTSNIQNALFNGQSNAIVIYKDQNGNELPSPLPNPFNTETQTITARIENVLSSNCYDETTINFVVIEQPELLMNDHWSICEGGTVEVVADSGYDEYQWSTGETTPSIVVENAGIYDLTVANVYGNLRCEATKSITVVTSNIATITNIETVDWTQNDNTITVFVEGYGDYEYSLNGITYQDQNEFTNLQADDFIIYVRDKNGCGVTTENVYLMYYPKYFTPNDDGYNDTWQLISSNSEPNNKVYIFDRYGKLLKELNPMGNGWDGTFNGNKLSSSDYWFVLERQNGKTYKGHFTLKR